MTEVVPILETPSVEKTDYGVVHESVKGLGARVTTDRFYTPTEDVVSEVCSSAKTAKESVCGMDFQNPADDCFPVDETVAEEVAEGVVEVPVVHKTIEDHAPPEDAVVSRTVAIEGVIISKNLAEPTMKTAVEEFGEATGVVTEVNDTIILTGSSLFRNLCVSLFVLHFLATSGISAMTSVQKSMIKTASKVDPMIIGHLLLLGTVGVIVLERFRRLESRWRG
ncbi:hypothetical protein BC829DRAFT_403071 [Chytridium lagenaria]|nr:hypothetical protein BC829DRAFT_403071 [Chytridium lagenaria]